MIPRPFFLKAIQNAFQVHPVVALLGPRQCGKTTLAKQYVHDEIGELPPSNYFDLERPSDLIRLTNPELVLSSLSGLIVIDEIQRIPELFPLLRVLADEGPSKRFLILGSASRDLIHQSSESLAGRIQYIEVTPFQLNETADLSRLWLRGGFPKAYLARTDQECARWRESYIQTYLEQDLPNLGINIPAPEMLRFWLMLSHYHGQTCNYSELGRSLDKRHTVIKHYIDILSGTFMLRQLTPWHENISKRQVKSPKIYFRDSGILHQLLQINDQSELLMNPRLGSSWEGFALETVIRYHHARPEQSFFWATPSGAELDLMLLIDGKKIGFEIKFTEQPKFTKSMRIAMEDLKLDHLYVIYPGKVTFPMQENVTAKALQDFSKL